eukprot:4309250-Amphidinium_carterae.1
MQGASSYDITDLVAAHIASSARAKVKCLWHGCALQNMVTKLKSSHAKSSSDSGVAQGLLSIVVVGAVGRTFPKGMQSKPRCTRGIQRATTGE